MRAGFEIKRIFFNNFFNSVKSSGIYSEVFEGPKVSVVIPIYDRTTLLRQAIDSVLAQDYTNFELLLVCDGSPESTLNVVRSYLYHEKVRAIFLDDNSGTAVRARNFGIANSTGEYIAFLDSDDICTESRLSNSVRVLETEKVDVVYGSWIALMDGSRKIRGIRNGQRIDSIHANYTILLDVCVPCQSTVTLRKSLLTVSGLLKPEMRYREDHELWLRLAFFGAKFRNINEIFTHLRLHSGNNELNFEKESSTWLEAIRESHTLKGPSVDQYKLVRD